MTLTGIPKQGPSFDFYSRQTVTWGTFGHDGYNGDGYQPDAIIPFSSQGIMIVNETTGSVVEVSFNGTNTHCRLDGTANSGTQVIQFNNRVNSLVWLKAIIGSPVVQIISWGIR